MATVNDRLVGDVLDGRYEIIDRVGRGGMATVYKARDRRLGRIVAVKVMRDDLDDDPDFARRFDTEARAVARLSDAHIVSVFDQGIDRDFPYIVMEFVEGTNLKAVIVKQGALPPARALPILEDIAGGLAAAHAAGIVHRDVKPENVLISRSGEVKVTDFGLARQTDTPTMTVADGVLGSLSYVSPERLLKSTADFSSDIYSAGVVAFEMLTGRKPFTGGPAEVYSQHLNQDVPAPSSVTGPGVIPAWLDALVVACGRRTPAARPTDGRELLRRLRLGMTAMQEGTENDPALIAAMSAPGGPGAAAPTAPAAPRHSDGTPPQYSAPIPAMPAAPPVPAAPPALPPVSHEDTPALQSGDEPAGRVPPPSRQKVYRRRRILVALLAAIVLAGLLTAGWWVTSGRFTTMPDITGRTQDAAGLLVANADLTLTTETAYSEDVAAGLVISTDPAPGTKVPRGNTVLAVISLGPERYPVPDNLAGMSQDDAQAALTNAHLTTGDVTQQYSETVPIGAIISCDPPAGTMVKPGTAVALVVSQGPAPIPVTDYTGHPATEAMEALAALGLVPKQVLAYSDDVAEGIVISQDPNNGELHKGDTVTLTVSQGPHMVTIPTGLVGSKAADAKKTLEDLGLKVVYSYLTPDIAGLRHDIVSYTDPSSGTSVKVGTRVTLYIS